VPGRTQCEAEEMYAESLDRLNNIQNFLIGYGLTGPAVGLTAIIALELAAFANDGEINRKKLEQGCKEEIRQQAEKDAAAKANGTSTSGAHRRPSGTLVIGQSQLRRDLRARDKFRRHQRGRGPAGDGRSLRLRLRSGRP
jgi:hypothetical protein